MLKPPRPDHQQPAHQQHQVGTAIVAAELVLTAAPADAMVKPDQVKLKAQQLQPTIASKLLATEFNRKIPLDHPAPPPNLQPHLWGLPCRLELPGLRTLYNA